MTRYYIETDGRVFLVEHAGVLDLPDEGEVPFPIDEIAPLATDPPAVFAVPRISRFPREWPGKDALVHRADVSPLVRKAVHATMPRVVVEGIAIRDGGDILLVKGSRGFTAGLWSLPGGFVRFGESPAEGLIREVREELRVEAAIDELIDVRAKLGEESRLHWIMLFYRITLGGTPDPDPDEIAEARFFPLDEARGLVCDSLMRAVISSLQEIHPDA